jgi:hypothetical protein
MSQHFFFLEAYIVSLSFAAYYTLSELSSKEQRNLMEEKTCELNESLSDDGDALSQMI